MSELDLQYRWLQKGDAELANLWLKGWKKHELELEMYPQTGLVMYNATDDTPVYVGFIWIPETSNMAMIGFITRNPFYKKKLPKDARKNFVSELRWACKELGRSVVITWTENELLVNDFKECGFAETSNKCSELIQKIL